MLFSGADNKILAALLVLIYVNLIQNLALLCKESLRKGFGKKMQAFRIHLKSFAAIGLLSFLGSALWFSAFALQKVAFVKVLGQVEIIFAFIISHIFFKEKNKKS